MAWMTDSTDDSPTLYTPKHGYRPREGSAIGRVRPSVCPFQLHLFEPLTLDLDLCVCMDHDPS